MEIKKVTDDAFSAYGKVLEGYDFSELLEVMKDTPLPEDEVVYVPGVKAMEEATVSERLKKSAYGGLPPWPCHKCNLPECPAASQEEESGRWRQCPPPMSGGTPAHSV